MSKGGIPVQPFFVLGGFIPPGQQGLGENPKYLESTAVVMSVIVDNFDLYSEDPEVLQDSIFPKQIHLKDDYLGRFKRN